jgi:hypothetical protein
MTSSNFVLHGGKFKRQNRHRDVCLPLIFLIPQSGLFSQSALDGKAKSSFGFEPFDKFLAHKSARCPHTAAMLDFVLRQAERTFCDHFGS